MGANPKEAISGLKDGECWTWPESDYGKAEIWRKNDVLFLFEIPMFGGAPSFSGAYPLGDVDALVLAVESWT